VSPQPSMHVFIFTFLFDLLCRGGRYMYIFLWSSKVKDIFFNMIGRLLDVWAFHALQNRRLISIGYVLLIVDRKFCSLSTRVIGVPGMGD